MNDTTIMRAKAVLATVECNYDHNESLMAYCVALREAIEAPTPNVTRTKAALVSIATVLDGASYATELVDEIDDIVELIT